MRDAWSSAYDGDARDLARRRRGRAARRLARRAGTRSSSWSAPRRIAPAGRTSSPGTVVNVDHHPGNTRYGALNLVDLPAAAVGEIVADLLDLLGWPLTPDVATNLWVSLVSDTGSFRYSNTTPKALALGARLVADGAAARARERVPLRGRAALDAEARGARPRDARAPRRRHASRPSSCPAASSPRAARRTRTRRGS